MADISKTINPIFFINYITEQHVKHSFNKCTIIITPSSIVPEYEIVMVKHYSNYLINIPLDYGNT